METLKTAIEKNDTSTIQKMIQQDSIDVNANIEVCVYSNLYEYSNYTKAAVLLQHS